MDVQYAVTEEAVKFIQLVFSAKENWLAYNTIPYVLEKGNIYTFQNKEHAQQFAINNISEYDNFKVVYAKSLTDLYHKIGAEKLNKLKNTSSIKKQAMDENAMRFNEGQFKRIGIADAFTPDVRAQMQQGVPFIQHNIKKDYDGDKVEAALHLKKSATSDYYFLNKFEMQLQKQGEAETLKQTFYLTGSVKNKEANNEQNQEPKITIKEGYNLLAGRQVLKNMVDPQGEQYQAWIKLDLKMDKLANGNYGSTQYPVQHLYPLDKTLEQYSIKELQNEKYKQSLIESLSRGNLQKATFVDKEGKEDRLYVGTDVTSGTLKVYDINKQVIQPEKLAERNYISKELANDLVPRLSLKEKEIPKQTEASNQTNKATKTIKNDKPEQKQARKQKIK